MTIWKRGDKWVGKFKHQGEQIWIGTHETRREALAAEARLRDELADVSPETIAGYAERWLRDYPRPAASTRSFYKGAIKAFVEEYGMRRMSSITRLEARALAQQIPLANLRVIRVMFNDAMRDGLVRHNPFSELRLERPRGRKDLVALTEDEIVELANAAITALNEKMGLTMRAWVLLAGFTGIRPGESVDLRWDDISGDEMVVRGTKTQAAQRQVVIPRIAREALAALPRHIGIPWVFVTERKRKFSKASLHYNFREIRQAAGRPKLTAYELRHACATNLMRRGVEPWAIAQQLGHSDHGGLVVRLYGHPTERDARDRIKRSYGENVKQLRTAGVR